VGLNPKLWNDKRVLVTGHTGFKGAWLTLLLKDLGAEVVGISLPPEGPQSLYFDGKIKEEVCLEFLQDIRDEKAIEDAIQASNIDYVFHLAAQAYVRRSVRNPLESISTNVVGTANVLTSALASKSVSGVTIVTTDKVYENLGGNLPFKESDKLGGQDPYSASKAAAELVVSSIRFSNNPRNIPVTTVRAGNVVGGGDWGEERLVPDLVRTLRSNLPLLIRNEGATRPWQYVLDCLFGYLLVAQSHLEKKENVPYNVNFGPEESLSVIELVNLFESAFGKKIASEIVKTPIIESSWLSLDSSLAHRFFGWKASLSPEQSVMQTAEWYLKFSSGEDAKSLMLAEISKYKVGKW
jgi:CDP-glucose 4,6-dehydratase